MSVSVPSPLLEALRAARRPLLVGHVTPDADCLTAVYGLGAGLAAHCGAEPIVALPADAVADRLEFLHAWANGLPTTPGDVDHADAVIVLDTAKLPRANVEGGGETLRRDGRPIINIDHHETNPNFGDVNWVVADASSAAELVYHILCALDVEFTPEIASLLYTGIYADTAGFSLPNCSGDAMAAAADLVHRGARVAEIGERLQRSRRQADFDLLRIVYANTHLTADGRIAYSTVSHDELIGAGCRAADIDDQVEVPRSLEGIDIAILFTEGVKGKIRINFRGEGDTTILDLARQFGGGGHLHAAGAILSGPVDEVARQVLERAARQLDGQADRIN